jgi:hypothetical protein
MFAPIAIAACLSQTQTIDVFVVSYFPVAGDQIDRSVTHDVGGSLAELREKTRRLTKEACAALENGSKFRGYKLASPPALTYRVVGEIEYTQAIPLRPKVGDNAPLPDYASIMNRIGCKDLVESRGVDEVWIWGYHGKIGLWESNMSSPHGDVSNSNRDNGDLPIYKRTYTVYHYNYGRGLGEMLENHLHQFEHLWNHVDGRETTPPEKWSELLFWGKFVGSDASHKIVTKPARCGWTHYAPNSESDYDWTNPRYVETDIEDWKPDGYGTTQMMNADRWDRDGVKWRIYWMQAVPGIGHGLTHKGKPLRNWWTFVSDWDRAKAERWTLVQP